MAFDPVHSAAKYFTPTAPIDEKELFAGRIDQVRSLIDVINQRGQHAILFGERGVGKTSLVNVISKFLTFDTLIYPRVNLICPRVNCDGLDDFGTVWQKLFDEIKVPAFSREAGFAKPLLQTLRPASEYFKGDRTPNDVRQLLKKISEQTLPILIVDEFDRLSPTAKGIFADLIKMLSDHAVEATVVIVGVADSVQELIAEHQSVERALVQIRMPRMSREEIEQIIDNGIQHLELKITRRAIGKIVLLAQGLPHYAHLLGFHSVQAAADRNSTTLSVRDIDTAIRKALQNAQASTESDYHRATQSTRKDNLFKQVLAACAISDIDDLGYFQASDIRQPMKQITGRHYDIPAFTHHLNAFCEDDRGCILQKTGKPRRYRFRFKNPLMQPFVIMQALADKMIQSELLKDHN